MHLDSDRDRFASARFTSFGGTRFKEKRELRGVSVERIIHRFALINLDDGFHRIHPLPLLEFVGVFSGRARDIEIEVAGERSAITRGERTVRSEFEPNYDIAFDRISRHDPAAHIDAVL